MPAAEIWAGGVGTALDNCGVGCRLAASRVPTMVIMTCVSEHSRSLSASVMAITKCRISLPPVNPFTVRRDVLGQRGRKGDQQLTAEKDHDQQDHHTQHTRTERGRTRPCLGRNAERNQVEPSPENFRINLAALRGSRIRVHPTESRLAGVRKGALHDHEQPQRKLRSRARGT